MSTLPAALSWITELATPSPSATIDPDVVTPGFAGFAAIALVAIVAVFLVGDMLRRIRRAGYRAEIDEQLDAEEAGAQAQDAGDATEASEATEDDDPTDGDDPRP